MIANPIPKLPVFRIAVETLRFTIANAITLLRYAWPLIVTLAVISAALYWHFYPLNEKTFSEQDGALLFTFVVPILWAIAGASIAIPWHRFILHNEIPVTADLVRAPGVIVLYAVVAIAIFAIAFAAIAVPMALMPTPIAEIFYELKPSNWLNLAVVSVFWTIFALVVSRPMLVLPALAIGNKDVGVNIAWSRTRGNSVRMAIGYILALLPALLLIHALDAFFGTPQQMSRTGFVLSFLTTDAINMTVGMTSVTFLSLAYRHFFGTVSDDALATRPQNEPNAAQ